ncbi:unnamed protein product [Soboliphyme baturini]|uniref:HMG box domain-containing protein n=1 Tax=Soboliphyme baturini TaxID=241478 RepID=A0A3P8ARY0_9BILA|nr:unnamed protein product [Soboliphyme baturini]
MLEDQSDFEKLDLLGEFGTDGCLSASQQSVADFVPSYTEKQKRNKSRKSVKIGVGGFVARPSRQRAERQGSEECFSSSDTHESPNVLFGGGNYLQDSGVGNVCAATDFQQAASSHAEDGGSDGKPKKRKRSRKKCQLDDFYPAYIQEAFFGNTVSDPKFMPPASNCIPLLEEVVPAPSEGPVGGDCEINAELMRKPLSSCSAGGGQSSGGVRLDTQMADSAVELNENEEIFPHELQHHDFTNLLDMLMQADIDSVVHDGGCISEKRPSSVKDDNLDNLIESALGGLDNGDVDRLMDNMLASEIREDGGGGGDRSNSNQLLTTVSQPPQQPSTSFDQSGTPFDVDCSQVAAAAAYALESQCKAVTLPKTTFVCQPELTIPSTSQSTFHHQPVMPTNNSPKVVECQGGGDMKSYLERWEQDEPLGERSSIAAVLHANIHYPELKFRYPHWAERAKHIAKLWRALNQDARQQYVQMARENRSMIRQESKARRLSPRRKDSSKTHAASAGTGSSMKVMTTTRCIPSGSEGDQEASFLASRMVVNSGSAAPGLLCDVNYSNLSRFSVTDGFGPVVGSSPQMKQQQQSPMFRTEPSATLSDSGPKQESDDLRLAAALPKYSASHAAVCLPSSSSGAGAGAVAALNKNESCYFRMPLVPNNVSTSFVTGGQLRMQQTAAAAASSYSSIVIEDGLKMHDPPVLMRRQSFSNDKTTTPLNFSLNSGMVMDRNAIMQSLKQQIDDNKQPPAQRIIKQSGTCFIVITHRSRECDVIASCSKASENFLIRGLDIKEEPYMDDRKCVTPNYSERFGASIRGPGSADSLTMPNYSEMDYHQQQGKASGPMFSQSHVSVFDEFLPGDGKEWVNRVNVHQQQQVASGYSTSDQWTASGTASIVAQQPNYSSGTNVTALAARIPVAQTRLPVHHSCPGALSPSPTYKDQYREDWLLKNQLSLENQQKALETELIQLRRTKKNTGSKQRQMRKNGLEPPEADQLAFTRLSQEISERQKLLDHVKKQLKQHSLLMQDYQTKRNAATAIENSRIVQNVISGGQPVVVASSSTSADLLAGSAATVYKFPYCAASSTAVAANTPPDFGRCGVVTEQFAPTPPQYRFTSAERSASVVAASPSPLMPPASPLIVGTRNFPCQKSHSADNVHQYAGTPPSDYAFASAVDPSSSLDRNVVRLNAAAVVSSIPPGSASATSNAGVMQSPAAEAKMKKKRSRKKKTSTTSALNEVKLLHVPRFGLNGQSGLLLDGTCGELQEVLVDRRLSMLERYSHTVEADIVDVLQRLINQVCSMVGGDREASDGANTLLKTLLQDSPVSLRDVEAEENRRKASDCKRFAVNAEINDASKRRSSWNAPTSPRKRQRKATKVKNVECLSLDSYSAFCEQVAMQLRCLAPLPIQEPVPKDDPLLSHFYGVTPLSNHKNYVIGNKVGRIQLAFIGDYYSQPLDGVDRTATVGAMAATPVSAPTLGSVPSSSSASAVPIISTGGFPDLINDGVAKCISPSIADDDRSTGSPTELIYNSQQCPEEEVLPNYPALKPSVGNEGRLSPNFRLVAAVPVRAVPPDPPFKALCSDSMLANNGGNTSMTTVVKTEGTDGLVNVTLTLDSDAMSNVHNVLRGLAFLLNIDVPEQFEIQMDTPPQTPERGSEDDNDYGGGHVSRPLLTALSITHPLRSLAAAREYNESQQLFCRHCEVSIQQAMVRKKLAELGLTPKEDVSAFMSFALTRIMF